MKWEHISGAAYRTRVFGGWLVKITEDVYHITASNGPYGHDFRVAMTFVPDPDHEWSIDNIQDISEEENIMDVTRTFLKEKDPPALPALGENKESSMLAARASMVMSASQCGWLQSGNMIKDVELVDSEVKRCFSKQCPEGSSGYPVHRYSFMILDDSPMFKRDWHKGDEGYESSGYDNEFQLI